VNGGWDTGTWDDATWDYVSQIVEVDTHDGDYLKKKFAKEVADAARRKAEIVYAFERIVEGRPEAAAEIAEPFMETRAATLPAIDYDRMLADLDRVQRIRDLHLELDDEDVLALI
jgi:hypothetical protein